MWFLCGKWTLLRLFYSGLYRAKICIFWDFALITVCMGLSQLLEVEKRPRANRFLYVRRRVLCYPNDFISFSSIELSFFFLGFSDLPYNEMTNNLYVCHFVILSFCDSVTSSVVSSFLYLNIFQSAPNLAHILLKQYLGMFFFYFNFLRFLLTF